jgi:large subunit ribosomal protein L1
LRICVIAEPGSKAAADARAAGAILVGEDEIFNQVKEGIVDFDRCICHVDSLQKMNKAGLGRILGPKGLMPSAKTGTVVNQVGSTVRNMVGGSEYREKIGVVRMAIGQLGFTPEEMQNNIKAFMDAVKKDIGQMSDRINKEIHEVVCRPMKLLHMEVANDHRS